MATGSSAPEVEERSHGWSWQRWLIIGVVVLVAGFVLGWGMVQVVQKRPFGSPTFNGTVIQSPTPLANFTLTGHNGEPVSLHDFRGKVVLLYFGYTYCPDVCPATMVELTKTMRALGNRADDVQVIMISVDPQRDTPEHLAEYVTHFHPSFIGLTGTDDEIAAAATPLGVFYEKQEGTVASGYLFDHTATVVAIDPEGYLRLVYPFDTPGEDIAADVRQLMN